MLSQNPNQEAQITKVIESGIRTTSDKESIPYQKLELRISTGAQAGATITVEINQTQTGELGYKIGERVYVTQLQNADGSVSYAISDQIRYPVLFNLTLIFIVLVLLVSKWRGLLSLLAMSFSFGVIFLMTLPLIMQGWQPVLVSLITALLIIPSSFYLSHGLNRKTHVAVVGTVVSLLVTGILAWLFIDTAHITGLASEEAGFLTIEKDGLINVKNLLLAGIIVGSLGILDDVTVSQASVVEQLKISNPKHNSKELFLRAMAVGQDHISSMVNTLVLVYAGASLPLLLLFINNPHPFTEVINQEIVAEEIIKMLVGSIGLIFAAPITTGLAAVVFGFLPQEKNRRPHPELDHSHSH